MLCPYCKGEVPDDAKKCMNCGEWLDPAYRKTPNEQQGCLSAFGEMFMSIAFWVFIFIIALITAYALLDYNGLIN